MLTFMPASAGPLRLAGERGREIGTRMRGSGLGVLAALAELGFEPHADAGRVLLHNCPFHALAGRQTALVCGLNHQFVRGLVDGLHAPAVEANLAPRPGACCVELVSRRRSQSRGSDR
jgi:predicted ArsR family transcriptional regulator